MMRDCQSQALVWSLAAFCSEVTVDIASLVICAGLPGVARRQVTFFASPKKVGKERRPEVRRRCAVPCVTRNDRPLRNSGSWMHCAEGRVLCSPSDSPRGLLLSFLRYSATLIGARSVRDDCGFTPSFPRRAGIQVE